MPEYLSPGVHVEERASNGPIEGASTSTAGMVGVTERGPVDVPILVTSVGEFDRWFGGWLSPRDFAGHCFLPHAIDGFFTNLGKRVYVTRILDTTNAQTSQTSLFRQEGIGTGPAGPQPLLLRAAAEGDATLITLPVPGLQQNGYVRVGEGGASEYRSVTAAPGAETSSIPLAFALTRSHIPPQGATIGVEEIEGASDGNAVASAAATEVGAEEIAIGGPAADVAQVVAGVLVAIGTPGDTVEHRFVTAVNAAAASITLDSPLLLPHPVNTPVQRLKLDAQSTPVTSQLERSALVGDALIFVADRQGHFTDRTRLVLIDRADTRNREVRRIGALTQVEIEPPSVDRYPAGSASEAVQLTDGTPATTLATPARRGSSFISVHGRTGLAEDDLLRIGDEFCTIRDIPSPAPVGPDPGIVRLHQTLAGDHADGTDVLHQTVGSPAHPTAVAFTSAPGPAVLLGDGTGYAAGSSLRIRTPDGIYHYHRMNTVDGQTPQSLALDRALTRDHAAGALVVGRQTLLTVQALDPGAWGDRLRISVDQESPLVQTRFRGMVSPTVIRLDSRVGVEVGTVLRLIDPTTGLTVGSLLKVESLNIGTGDLTLRTGLDAGQLAAIAAAGQPMPVQSVEFRLNVELLRQPDPVVPSRDETLIDTEMFRGLSMDPRHSRYVHRVIGTTWIPGATSDADQRPLRLADRRSEGESNYIRVLDQASGSDLQEARFGPELLVDSLPGGRTQPARLRLEGGQDSIGTLAPVNYRGTVGADPEGHTGLQTFRNVEEISIVACPGQTDPDVQNAIIEHCTEMRYRFAVLDGQPPPRDALADIQQQRQQFDTRYAALYHPWLLIRDPFPTSMVNVPLYPVPPSGHMLGIYARTDVERGVHKAPANEVVRGILGLQRILNREQQDILNPYPVNINVIRDFRRHNRGIRVYGGRVITSDSDWKYVNVRRLIIFIEQSLDRGLQWVVFEPNAEPLWARVRRAISNFLTLVWRNGGLEGGKVEEAFYVKCDETTMTQTDIDSGRLICVVGVAPVKPAEFVIIRIGLWTARAD